MTAGALIGGRFRLEALAGSGGMGAVWRARDEETGDAVALKLLHPHAFPEAARLAREAQALAALQHPNIVRYVAHASLEAGLPFLAMEWLEGEDLHTRLDRGPLCLADAVTLGIVVADALHAAHRVGLVHRDIKPSNLLICGGDPRTVKVLDFGIVRWHGRGMTASGQAFGTPGYMAPEQARSAGRVDARADVFSLGCVLFEALTGVGVFCGENIMAVLAKVMMEPAPALSEALPGAPLALEALLAKMLEKEADARPADAGAVRAALAALEIEPGPPSLAPSRRHRVVTEVERRIVSLVLARRGARAPVAATEVAELALDPLRAALWPHGERVELLADGSILVLPVTTGSARDQANQAARCALALRAELPSWSISVGSGRADSTGTGSLGEAIDRAARSLGMADAIHLDEVTSAFLDPRFEVLQQGAAAFVLIGEHAQAEQVRTVLGKPTPCVGRERDLAALASYLDECIAQTRARPILVTGPPGIGKTRLRAELLRDVHARLPSVEVWMARGDPVSEGSPYAMIAGALRRAAGIEGAPRAVAEEKLRALVARHVPVEQRMSVVEFLGELADVPGEGEGSIQLRAARRDPALMGDRIARALCDLFVAESAAHPLLLVLEDLHWGDVPSVKAIDAVLRAARDLPLMVLALARPEVHESFPRLWSARALATLPLGELGDSAAEELVRAVLGESIASAAASRLVERAAGNPFFLEELCRAAARGHADASSLPETVLGVVEGRLEELSPQARRVLRAASVFGLVFWSSAAGRLLGSARTVTEAVAELLDREVIQERRQSRFVKQREYVFQHALVREAAYSTLPEDDRIAAHRLAGEWLEAEGERDSAMLAAHFEAGRELERAAVHYERAAAHALEGNDFAAVHARVARAVACGASGQLLGKLRVLEARARMWSGEMGPSLHAAEAALLALGEETAAWYDALWLIATTSASIGNPSRVEEVSLLVAHEMPQGAGSAWFGGCAMIAINLLFCDRVAAAGRLLECLEAVPSAFLDEDPMSRAQLAVLRAIWVQHAGDLGARTTLLRQAIADFDFLGAVRPATLQRVNLAWGYLDVGAFAAAEELCGQILATAQQVGLVHVERGARYCMGRALTHRGRWDEARALLEEAAAAFETSGDRRLAGAATIALVEACLAAGDLAAGAAAAERAIALVEQLPPFLALAMAMHAEVLLRQGRPAEALTLAQDAVAPLHLGHHAVQNEARIHLVYIEALRATGAMDAARVEIERASAALQARAAKIANAEWRKSYLEALPENARTLELARASVGPSSAPAP
jgi:eukaryotic-like serine/threonine-protein kinase